MNSFINRTRYRASHCRECGEHIGVIRRALKALGFDDAHRCPVFTPQEGQKIDVGGCVGRIKIVSEDLLIVSGVYHYPILAEENPEDWEEPWTFAYRFDEMPPFGDIKTKPYRAYDDMPIWDFSDSAKFNSRDISVV